jgi:hypothetical protein
MSIPGVPRGEADPGTIGTAVDWLMRLLTYPTPSLQLAAYGARLCGMLSALKDLAHGLGRPLIKGATDKPLSGEDVVGWLIWWPVRREPARQPRLVASCPERAPA